MPPTTPPPPNNFGLLVTFKWVDPESITECYKNFSKFNIYSGALPMVDCFKYLSRSSLPRTVGVDVLMCT
uniref:Uncharacterized protein n=1 Tax=Leersia perrieri TaxID=77586 RepID=A0A0D9VE25_9ORYZ